MNVLDLVTLNEDRTNQERELADRQAAEASVKQLGSDILAGMDTKKAKEKAEWVATPAYTYTWYEVDPADLYPAMVDYITACLETQQAGDGIIRAEYYPVAQSLPAAAWQLALMPRDKISEAEHVQWRATALEICRKWFTELLHRACRWRAAGMNKPELMHTEPPAGFTAPIGLHILKDERYRL